jgi:hypothetical protein
MAMSAYVGITKQRHLIGQYSKGSINTMTDTAPSNLNRPSCNASHAARLEMNRRLLDGVGLDPAGNWNHRILHALCMWEASGCSVE